MVEYKRINDYLFFFFRR